VLRDSCPQLSCDEKAGAKGKGPEGVAQGEAEAKMAAWLAGMYKKVQNKPAAPPPKTMTLQFSELEFLFNSKPESVER